MASFIQERYSHYCLTYGDIWEHLPTLKKYASECSSVAELGVSIMISTYAFLQGLRESKAEGKKSLHCVDLRVPAHVNNTINKARECGIDMSFYEENSATVELPPVDLCFIDTWHIYGHLKRELEKHAPRANKYIIMHDTEVDKIDGESIRCGMNIDEQVKSSGYSREEITKGLQPAIDEFLASHPEWKVKEHFTNNNGLTVLERVSA